MKHLFDTDIAKVHGFAAAVIYENACHWVKVNKANGANLHEGRHWTYNSVKAYGEIFDYLTPWQIRAALDTLVDAGLLLKGRFNQKGYDRTAWYTTADDSSKCENNPENIHLMPAANGLDVEHNSSCGEHQDHLRDITNGFDENRKPIPDIKPNLNQLENTQDARAAHPFDIKRGGIPEPILEQLQRIEKLSGRAIHAPSLLVPADEAVRLIGLEAVVNALRGIVTAYEDPRQDRDRIPRQLVPFLRSADRMLDWGSRVKPTTPHPETGPPTLSTVAWLESLSDSERDHEFNEARRLGQTWPEEVKTRWPESLTTQAS